MTWNRLVIAVLTLSTIILIYLITKVDNWAPWCLGVLLLAHWGIKKDVKPISWIQFLPAGLLTLLCFYLIYNYANPMWHKFVGWQTKSIHHAFQWNKFFDSIPGNDAAFMRIWQPRWLTKYMQTVYMYGFTLSYWICVIRAFFTKDVKKMGLYSLAGYLLQVPLILFFYNTILLQEVWYVQGTPDLLARHLTTEQQYSTAMNCFPSMHTSIAFTAILLSRRESSRWYRLIIGIFCTSIIISTMYLKVHWVLDVVAGMLFAYGCVKLADWIVNSKAFVQFTIKFERFGTKLYHSLTRADQDLPG